MHLLDKLEWPIIFAHRGASISAPENTLSAFELAVKLGARAIELDAMLSSDGIPVVFHDHTLERTTNGRGFVRDFTYADLIKLDAGAWFSEEFAGERIPSLEQVLKSVSKEVLVNIELKNYHAPLDNLTEKVLQLVDGVGLWDSVLFSSFLPRNLKIIRKRNPEAKVALLCPSGLKGWLMRSSLYMKLSPEFIHPSLEDVDKKYILQEHARSRRVHVWTVNNKRKAKELFENKIDGIFTDDPLIMQEGKTKFHPR